LSINKILGPRTSEKGKSKESEAGISIGDMAMQLDKVLGLCSWPKPKVLFMDKL
jgi:hypothetical protein